MNDIQALTWEDFEWFCFYLLRHLGYERTCRPKKGEYGSDGGIDLTCYKNGEKILVQCKHWANGSHGFLPTKVIAEHFGYMKLNGGHLGIVMTPLELSSMDREDAEKLNIELIGRHEIERAMKSINPNFGEQLDVAESPPAQG